jgi:hypothetical protein
MIFKQIQDKTETAVICTESHNLTVLAQAYTITIIKSDKYKDEQKGNKLLFLIK